MIASGCLALETCAWLPHGRAGPTPGHLEGRGGDGRETSNGAGERAAPLNSGLGRLASRALLSYSRSHLFGAK
ncbi:hypothetical protein EYF80_033371 [Liparis tanakae]|uniref:Uncharacterized protein n=1 Tax=Liparis tanakae TaxID=230148 RepID=A0A4Z2GT41_9TELE|nr:hypothetical protein EYF80_033371 [Liparis tanakae]